MSDVCTIIPNCFRLNIEAIIFKQGSFINYLFKLTIRPVHMYFLISAKPLITAYPVLSDAGEGVRLWICATGTAMIHTGTSQAVRQLGAAQQRLQNKRIASQS